MSSPRLKISRQAQSAVPEELDILLLEYGVLIGMDYPMSFRRFRAQTPTPRLKDALSLG